jgi:hypothetical protein
MIFSRIGNGHDHSITQLLQMTTFEAGYFIFGTSIFSSLAKQFVMVSLHYAGTAQWKKRGGM